MSQIPRLAIGTVQPGTDSRPMTWGLLDLMRREGMQVRHFHSQACFVAVDGAPVATGVRSRYLDSWLMNREVCHSLFLQGAAEADLAVVQGAFQGTFAADQGRSAFESSDAFRPAQRKGSHLEDLVQWLNLPSLAVVDATRLEDCRHPDLPEDVDGLLLDQVSNPSDFCRLKTHFEILLGVPVVGGMGRVSRLREELDSLEPGQAPRSPLCHRFGQAAARYLDVERLVQISQRRPLASVIAPSTKPPRRRGSLRVAVAYDEAFHCYFPATLEMLEQMGATLVDFSPLHDEDLPRGIDLVYLGCGHPERHAAQLSANQCMLLALRRFACEGGAIYGEGGGLAYLCESIQCGDNPPAPMAGLLPAQAVLNPDCGPPRPVEVSLDSDLWLGRRGEQLRGYLNSMWHLEPTGPLEKHTAGGQDSCAFVSHGATLGSQVHLDFAAQSKFLRRFFQLRRFKAGAIAAHRSAT
jgi:cobyrinic acid a,c-diamide synthase